MTSSLLVGRSRHGNQQRDAITDSWNLKACDGWYQQSTGSGERRFSWPRADTQRYERSLIPCNKKVQQKKLSWQTSALAMHLPLAR